MIRQLSVLLLMIAVSAPVFANSESAGIPVLAATDFTGKPPAYLSNGMIGVRPGPNPLLPALATVSGYVGDYESEPFEAFAQAPSPFAADIRVGDFSMQKLAEKVSVQRQSLDLANGELHTEMTFQPTSEITLKVDVVQFLSRSTPCLALQRITVTPNCDIDIEISSLANEGVRSRTRLGIASRGSKPTKFKGRKDQEVSLDVIVAMVSERYHSEPDLQAIRMVGWGNMLGFETLQKLNQIEWNDLWQSRVRIVGDAEARRALDVAFFYLHSSAHRSCKTGIPPFGFSQVQDYSGHVFWDMDHWMLHVLLPTDPDAARAIVEYRSGGLAAARDAARLYGYRGAQFPWEGSNLGYEVTPTNAATGWAEQQVNACVGLAAWESMVALGDDEFSRNTAWPILREVAKWIESRGQWTNRGFEIHHIMGADESRDGASNNAHTNLLCQMVIRRAILAAEQLNEPVPPAWSEIVDKMVIPKAADTGVIIQDDRGRSRCRQRCLRSWQFTTAVLPRSYAVWRSGQRVIQKNI